MRDGTISNVNVPPGQSALITNDPGFWISSSHNQTAIYMGYRVDTYGGVIFDTSNLPADLNTFREYLARSIQHLTSAGFSKGFWFSVPTTTPEYVTVLIREFGFYVHHARKEYFMLTKWNDNTRPDPIPPVSMHQVGVGCVITRNDGSILLVKEKSGPASVKGGIWKLPTGLVDPKEDLQDAAIREAKEETCLDCRFDSIVCFRHSHGGSPSLGATSDLFFVCLLKLIDEHQQTCLQESEILESCWTHFSRIHETTGCTPGTAAYELMNRVVDIVNKSSDQVISCTKLPAWRRNNCEQWIFFPENTT